MKLFHCLWMAFALAFGASAAFAQTFSIGDMLAPGGVNVGGGVVATATEIGTGTGVPGVNHGDTGLTNPNLGRTWQGNGFDPNRSPGTMQQATRVNGNDFSTFDEGIAKDYADAIGFHIEFTRNGAPFAAPVEYFYALDVDAGVEWKTAFAFNGNTFVQPSFDLATPSNLATTSETVDSTTWATSLGLDIGQNIPTTYPITSPTTTNGSDPDDSPHQIIYDFGVLATDVVFLFGLQDDRSATTNGSANSGISGITLAIPELTTTKTLGATGALQPDGTFTQEFSILVQNTGATSITDITLVDDLEALFGEAYDPSTVALDATSGVTVVPTLSSVTGSTGVSANPNYDGDSTDALISGVGSLMDVGDEFTVTYTILLDSLELDGSEANTVTASGTPPVGVPLVFTDDDVGPGNDLDDGTAGVVIVPPAALPSLDIEKLVDDDAPVSGQTVTYTYTVTNDGNVNIEDVTVSDVHGGAGTLGPIEIGTLTNTSTNSSDDGVDNAIDLLAPGDVVTFTAEYMVETGDEGTSVSNTATATGDPVAGTLNDVADRQDIEVIVVPDPVENFVLDTTNGNECTDLGGTLAGGNVFTAFDNGTLGFAPNGDPQFSTATNPFGASLVGATYDTYGNVGFGEFSVVSNIQTARNRFQHDGGIYDPVNGVAGRFFHIDPQNFTEFPAVNLSGLSSTDFYEVSFWVADAELNAGNVSRVSILADGATVFSTPNIDNGPANATMVWTKYSFVVQPTSSDLEIVIRIVDEDLNAITNGSGRDIHMDEISVVLCDGLQPPVAEDQAVTSGLIEPVSFDIDALTSDADGTVDLSALQIDVDLGDFPASTSLSADGQTLTVPGQGVWDFDDATGLMTFTPEDGFVGDPTPIGYTVDDNDSLTSNTAELSIDYGEPPVATGETLESGPIEPVSFDPVSDLTSDSDGDIDPTTVSLVPPAGATGIITDGAGDVIGFTVPDEGEWEVNPATGVVSFTPSEDLIGDPTPVDFSVRDDDGNTSNEATLAIDYGEPPVADDETIVSGPITPVTFDPIADLTTDPDGTVDPESVSLTVLPGAADVVTDADGDVLGFTVPGEGVWSVDPDTGEVTFTPEDDFVGDPTPVEYSVRDDDGNTSLAPGELSIDYGDPPIAEDNSEFSATIEPVTISPLGNDSDPDGGTLEPTSVVLTTAELPAGAILAPDGKSMDVPGEGTWTVAANGDITFTPEDGFTSSPTPVTYTVEDNDGNVSNPATLIIQYGEPPVAANNTEVDLPLGDPFTLDPLSNDVDLDGGLDPTTVVFTGTDAPDDAVVSADGKTLEVPGEGVWTIDETTGAMTFTPEDGFQGDPTPVAYTVDDIDGNTSNEAIVTLEFLDPPVAEDDAVFSDAITPVTVNPLANDSDPDSLLDETSVVLLTLDGAPDGSTLSADGKTLTVPGEGVWTVADNGEVTFTPDPALEGNPSPVGYTVEDRDGNVSNVATITVEFGLPPVAENDFVNGLTAGQTGSINPLLNDEDPDGTLDPTSVVLTGTGAPSGSILSGDGRTLVVPGEGTWTVDPVTGVISFIPEDGFVGSPTPAAYTVADNAGNVTNEALVSLSYEPTALTGTVWLDDDKDGVIDDGESRVAGALVELINSDGEVIATAVTDANGDYTLAGFARDIYSVRFTDSDGTVLGTLEGLDFINNDVLSEQNQPVVEAAVGDLTLTKTTPLSTVVLGQAVPYEITVTNNTAFDVTADLIDILPTGLVFVPDSGLLDGVAVEPLMSGQTLTWQGVVVPGNDALTLELVARVGPNAPVGDLTNTVQATDSVTGVPIATPATATVRRNPEAVFDCTDIIGKVFDDRNFDGYQNAPGLDATVSSRGHDITNQDIFADGKGGGKFTPAPAPHSEPGLPHVRLFTPTGTVVTTDEYGRYSIPCAELPGGNGTNFTLKLDDRSLPTGYRVTTENPRTMRVTAGIMTELNFGAALGRVVDIDLTAAAFDADNAPVDRLEQGIARILQQVADEPSVLRISYFSGGEERESIKDRLDQLEDFINTRWRGIGAYRLIVERDVKYLQ
ncbi:MAG: Ig-like domain-containing protein [Pseudomonadota bacterium]